jgi:hypothetical protein
LTRQKKSVFLRSIQGLVILIQPLIKSLKGDLPLMKKIFAIFVAMLFVASLSLAVVGCKKKEEAPTEAPKVEAPVAQPAPAATVVPAPEATVVPAPAK